MSKDRQIDIERDLMKHYSDGEMFIEALAVAIEEEQCNTTETSQN